jgi:hypothetical protein
MRGGARPNAGRRKKSDRHHHLAGDPTNRGKGVARDPDAPPPVKPSRIVMPQGQLTSEAEQGYWQLFEPEARAAGTLTNQTRGGFVLLCQIAARVDAVWEQIDREGYTFDSAAGSRAHPLWTSYRSLVQRLESLMQRYQLAAMAKPVEPVGVPPAGRRDTEAEALRRLMSVV